MKPKTLLISIYNKLKNAKKENLLTFALLFIAGILTLIPGVTYLLTTFVSKIPANQTYDWLIARSVLSIFMMLPSLILFSAGYLLLESHSMGWKLAAATCVASILLAILNPSGIDLALSIGFLSGLAAALEIRSRRGGESVLKDSPIAIENIAILGMYICLIICISTIVFLFGYTIMRGAPYINLDFLTKTNYNWVQAGQVLAQLSSTSPGGILGYALGTIVLTVTCECIAIPLGLAAAIYLSEYAGRNKLTETIRFFIETLAGLPSVVIGLLVFLIIVRSLGWGFTVQGTAIGLAIMILPFNIRVVEEAMRAVPDAFREASFALGATKWETSKNIVFYAATPGIITGILLGAGAAMGESALVLVAQSLTYPAGTPFNPTLPILSNLFGKQANGFPSLAVFIYNAATLSPIEVGIGHSKLQGYVINQEAWSVAFAGAAVLIAMYLLICVIAMFARNRLAKKITGK